jgi:hypothetical protein
MGRTDQGERRIVAIVAGRTLPVDTLFARL